jgi:hypothetical protein
VEWRRSAALHRRAAGQAHLRFAAERFVGRIIDEVVDVRRVQAREALDLVREAAALVARERDLAPHRVEPVAHPNRRQHEHHRGLSWMRRRCPIVEKGSQIPSSRASSYFS